MTDQPAADQPPLVAGVYVDDATLDRMRDSLHGDNCGCGEWDSHSGEYVDRMDATIHAVLYPLTPARPAVQPDSGYRDKVARAINDAVFVDPKKVYDESYTLADAALAVRDAEMEQIRADLAEARAELGRYQEAVEKFRRRIVDVQARAYVLMWLHAEAAWQRDAERESRFRWAEEAAEMTATVARISKIAGTTIVPPEDWRRQVGACTSSGAAVDLIETWGATPLAELPEPEWQAFHDAVTSARASDEPDLRCAMTDDDGNRCVKGRAMPHHHEFDYSYRDGDGTEVGGE